MQNQLMFVVWVILTTHPSSPLHEVLREALTEALFLSTKTAKYIPPKSLFEIVVKDRETFAWQIELNKLQKMIKQILQINAVKEEKFRLCISIGVNVPSHDKSNLLVL